MKTTMQTNLKSPLNRAIKYLIFYRYIRRCEQILRPVQMKDVVFHMVNNSPPLTDRIGGSSGLRSGCAVFAYCIYTFTAIAMKYIQSFLYVIKWLCLYSIMVIIYSDGMTIFLDSLLMS